MFLLFKLAFSEKQHHEKEELDENDFSNVSGA